jgi:hypothetical protein
MHSEMPAGAAGCVVEFWIVEVEFVTVLVAGEAVLACNIVLAEEVLVAEELLLAEKVLLSAGADWNRGQVGGGTGTGASWA